MVGLKGNTLLESLIALVILMVISSILFISLVRIEKSFNSDLKLYALSVYKSELNSNSETKESLLIKDYSSFYVVREIIHSSQGYNILSVTVSSNDDKILFCGNRILNTSYLHKDE